MIATVRRRMGRQPEQEGETMNYINAIKHANTTNELNAIVDAYLAEIGEYENSCGETYGEAAYRLGGDKILEAAEARWFEIEG